MNEARLEEAKALFGYICDNALELMSQPDRLEGLSWTYFRHLCDALDLPYSAMEAKYTRPLPEIVF